MYFCISDTPWQVLTTAYKQKLRCS